MLPVPNCRANRLCRPQDLNKHSPFEQEPLCWPRDYSHTMDTDFGLLRRPIKGDKCRYVWQRAMLAVG
jgi:hypothetical protein